MVQPRKRSRSSPRSIPLVIGVLCCLAVVAAAETEDAAVKTLDAFIADQQIDKTQPGWKTKLKQPPKAEFEAGTSYFWNLDTNKGNIKIKLMPDSAPMHVSSTIYLSRLGFYDNVIFHRVIDGFMAQGGDPLGRGTGGPGYQYDGEFDAKVKHDRGGLLSMANRGPGTDGSQFFLTFVETPWLDGKHTIFGEVVGDASKKTVKNLEERGTRSGKPTEKMEIRKATVRIE